MNRASVAVHPTARERNVDRIDLGNSNRLGFLTSEDARGPERPWYEACSKKPPAALETCWKGTAMFRRVWIVAALGAAIVATNACLGSALRVDQTLPPTFADLATIKSVEVTTQSGEVLLRGSFPEGANSSSKFERTASLTRPDSTTARGTALRTAALQSFARDACVRFFCRVQPGHAAGPT